MADVRAVLLAGGEGRRMARLGAGRLKPLIPFGGVCRLIDFSLANARRSGFAEVLLLPQHDERRLLDDLYRVWWKPDFRVHFGPHDETYRSGRPDVPPPTGPPERGTADALIRKARYIFTPGTAQVLVLHADHVYRHDYRQLVRAHRAGGAALTIAYQRIARRYVHLFGMVAFGPDGSLARFEEKPAVPTSDLVFAAFCVFDAAILHRYLELLDGTDWRHDISRDVIPAMLAGGERIQGYQVDGYWADIGTVERYHRANLALLRPAPALSLVDMPVVLASRIRRRLVTAGPGVARSVVPADLVNHGRIEGTVVFPGVRIGRGAHVRDSVLLPGTTVAGGAVIDSAVVTETGAVQQAHDVAEVARG